MAISSMQEFVARTVEKRFTRGMFVMKTKGHSCLSVRYDIPLRSHTDKVRVLWQEALPKVTL